MSIFDFFSNWLPSVRNETSRSDSNKRTALLNDLEVRLRTEADWREAFALMHCLSVLKDPIIPHLLKKLPETVQSLFPISEVEAQVFDLWRKSYAVRLAVKSISSNELFALLDRGHFRIYQQLILLGKQEDDIREIQRKIPERYQQYDEAHSGFWAISNSEERNRLLINFARVVTRNLSGKEVSDLQLLLYIGLMVNNTVIATAEVFDGYCPPGRDTT